MHVVLAHLVPLVTTNGEWRLRVSQQGGYYSQLSVLDRLIADLKKEKFLEPSSLSKFLDQYCAAELVARARTTVAVSPAYCHLPTSRAKLPKDAVELEMLLNVERVRCWACAVAARVVVFAGTVLRVCLFPLSIVPRMGRCSARDRRGVSATMSRFISLPCRVPCDRTESWWFSWRVSTRASTS